MLFQKKIDRAFKLQKELKDAQYAGREAELKAFEEQEVVYEKNDKLALFLSAALIFGPIILFFAVITFLAFYFLW